MIILATTLFTNGYMMASKKWFSLMAVAALISSSVWAQDADSSADADNSAPAAETTYASHEEAPTAYYGELGYTTLKGRSNSVQGNTFKPKMLRGVVGKPLNPWLNGELMLGIGASGARVLPPAPATTLADAEIKTLLALYATPTLHFGNGGRVYGRLGWANITFSDLPLAIPGPLQSRSLYSKHDSLSWGVGASFPITQSLSVGADYMLYYKRKGEKLDGLTVNLGYKF